MHEHDVHNDMACLDLIGQGHWWWIGRFGPPRHAEVVVFELGLTQAVGPHVSRPAASLSARIGPCRGWVVADRVFGDQGCGYKVMGLPLVAAFHSFSHHRVLYTTKSNRQALIPAFRGSWRNSNLRTKGRRIHKMGDGMGTQGHQSMRLHQSTKKLIRLGD